MLDSALLHSLLPDVSLRVLEETASTNTDAREWLKAGAAHGSLTVAARQSGGRGRMGRVFVSPEGGLYMSLVLKSALPAGMITTLCAVAVRRVVAEICGMALDIKWVNDLQRAGKKVCGSLCGGVYAGDRLLGVIAGIGLNVSRGEFPPELRQIAASLYPAGKAPAPLEVFAARITQEILDMLPLAPAHMAEYRAACITLGRRVWWHQGEALREGLALDVDDSGGLRIRTDEGEVTLSAGEVSIRPRD